MGKTVNNRYVRFEKKVTRREGKKNPRKKENSDRNSADLNSIIDRILLDSHAGSRRIPKFL